MYSLHFYMFYSMSQFCRLRRSRCCILQYQFYISYACTTIEIPFVWQIIFSKASYNAQRYSTTTRQRNKEPAINVAKRNVRRICKPLKNAVQSRPKYWISVKTNQYCAKIWIPGLVNTDNYQTHETYVNYWTYINNHTKDTKRTMYMKLCVEMHWQIRWKDIYHQPPPPRTHTPWIAFGLDGNVFQNVRELFWKWSNRRVRIAFQNYWNCTALLL